MASIAIGSRPENGSSRTSSSGWLTRAAMSWTRCWLPCDSASRRSLRPVGEAEPLEPGVDAAAHVAGASGRTVGRGTRVGPAPAFAGTGPALRACSRTGPARRPDRCAPPPHRAGVQLDEPEHRPHGCRLSRPVGTEEPRQPPRAGGERAPVERRHDTEALGRRVELEQRRLRASTGRGLGPGTRLAAAELEPLGEGLARSLDPVLRGLDGAELEHRRVELREEQRGTRAHARSVSPDGSPRTPQPRGRSGRLATVRLAGPQAAVARTTRSHARPDPMKRGEPVLGPHRQRSQRTYPTSNDSTRLRRRVRRGRRSLPATRGTRTVRPV